MKPTPIKIVTFVCVALFVVAGAAVVLQAIRDPGSIKPSPYELMIVAWHTLLVYFFLIVVIRLIGRRTLSQLSPTDLMVLLLLGSAVETAMVTANTALKAGFVSATVLMVANFLLTRLMLRSKKLRHLVNGGPVLLVHDGNFVQENLMRVGYTVADVKQAMREREIGAVSDVRFGVLEPDGEINFVRRSQPGKGGFPELLGNQNVDSDSD